MAKATTHKTIPSTSAAKSGTTGDEAVTQDTKADKAETDDSNNTDNTETTEGTDKPAVGDGVTGVTNDGASGTSNDDATGDNNHGDAVTKEGDAPEGDNTDRRPGEAVSGEMTMGDATAAGFAPAATMHGPKRTGIIAERTLAVLSAFAKPDTTATATSNIHDDLGIGRSELGDLTDEIETEFDVSISMSESQNWLLVRDVVNTVLRKVAAQG